MLEGAVAELERRAGEDGLVLDVGGWALPLTRADWVLDLMPYETRGLYAYDRDVAAPHERFSAETWVRRDICAREPWPWPDDHFDLAVCSHTLEDVRDPVWVCSELSRVAKAGYVEVPSRLEEHSWGIHGPWAGWSHHHWIAEVRYGGLEFVFKPHLMHNRDTDHFPQGFHATLTPEERVQSLWWKGTLPATERIFVEATEIDAYLADFVAAETARRPEARRRRRRFRH
jgi:hypothetical protein